nr:IS110 family transposase [Gordonia hydrophobica]
MISLNQVKNLRGRYGSAGNKDDRFDAFVLADTLRTDRVRLRGTDSRHRCHYRPATCLPRPQRPDQSPCGRCQSTSGAPAQRAASSRRTVQRHRLHDQPGIPDPLRHPGQDRLADPETTR